MSQSSNPSRPDSEETPGIERRIRARFSSNLETFCQPGTGRLENFWWTARVRDISSSGIGLILHRRFDPGTVLAVELQNNAQSIAVTIQARVMHVKAMGEGDWVHGCAFNQPLPEPDLKQLLELTES